MKRRNAVKDGKRRRSPYAKHGKRPYLYPASVTAPTEAFPLATLVAWRRREGLRGAP